MEAMGLVTIGRNMLLRDLLQSVWRLRGLEKGQKVKFLIDEEVESIICHTLQLDAKEKIGFPEILNFSSSIVEQQGTDNFKSFKNQVWNLPQSLLIETILRSDISPKRRKKAYERLKETWIKQIDFTATTLYGSPAMERPSTVVIAEETKNPKPFLQEIGQDLPFLKNQIDARLIEVDQLSTLAAKHVHPMIISPIADDSETVEIENETQVERSRSRSRNTGCE